MESNKVKGIFAEYIGGAKWGDEGKGKITHRECDDAELVIRATGGSNAGHTVIYDGKKLGLHLIPSGVIKPNTTCLIGQGVAFDPLIFLKELVSLENIGVHGLRSRIKISGRAPVVLLVLE